MSDFLVVYLDSIDERLLEYLDEDDELRLDAVQRLPKPANDPSGSHPVNQTQINSQLQAQSAPVFDPRALLFLISVHAVLFSSPLHEAVVAEPTPSVPKGGL